MCRAGKVDVRFARQAWDSGCIDALGKALAGGSAWQVWGNVHLDVAARAFRVAGVGLRTSDALTRSGRQWTVDPRGRCGETCIWTLLRVRFTWQAWGRVATGGVANVDSHGRRREACTQRGFRVAGAGNGAIDGLAGHRFAWQAQGIVRPS